MEAKAVYEKPLLLTIGEVEKLTLYNTSGTHYDHHVEAHAGDTFDPHIVS